MDFVNRSGIGNIILAFSNATSLLPIMTAYGKGDFWTMGVIILVAIASFISHLCQTGYNGLWGFGVSMKLFIFLNIVDVISCWIVISRISVLYLRTYGFSPLGIVADPVLFFSSMTAFLINFISCRDRSDKTYFVWIHSFWHLIVFICLDAWLQIFLEEKKINNL